MWLNTSITKWFYKSSHYETCILRRNTLSSTKFTFLITPEGHSYHPVLFILEFTGGYTPLGRGYVKHNSDFFIEDIVIALCWQAAFFLINDVALTCPALMSCMIYPSVEAKCTLGDSKQDTTHLLSLVSGSVLLNIQFYPVC